MSDLMTGILGAMVGGGNQVKKISEEDRAALAQKLRDERLAASRMAEQKDDQLFRKGEGKAGREATAEQKRLDRESEEKRAKERNKTLLDLSLIHI